MGVFINKGIWVCKWEPKVASTAFVKNQFVELASGFLQPCTSSTVNIAGVNQDYAVASSDATTVKIPFWVPKSKAATVLAETTAALTIGTAYDLSDSDTVNQAGTTNKPVRCVKSISSTQAEVTINIPQLA